MSRLFSRVVIFVLSLAVVFVSTVTNTTYAAEDFLKSRHEQSVRTTREFAAQKADIYPVGGKRTIKKGFQRPKIIFGSSS